MTGRRSPTRVQIRPVRADELAATGRLVLDAYDRVGAMSGGYRDELRDTAARIDDETSVLVAVDDDGTLLGTVTVVSACSDHFEHDGHGDGGFRALAVAPTAQGVGVGAGLVDRVVEDARRAGWRRLAITTMEWMTAAQALYERRGFVRRPDLDVRYPTGVGRGYVLDLTGDAAAAFPAPGPVPDEPPWYADLGEDRPSC